MAANRRLTDTQVKSINLGLGHPAKGYNVGKTLQALAIRAGEAVLEVGTSSSDHTMTASTDRPITIYADSASVAASTSIEPVFVSMTMTGAAGVGGRSRFLMTTNVALGGWSNAVKAEVVYEASGRTTGLGSALCAEITLSAGTSSGSYAPLESEYTMASGALTGTASSFLYCNVSGAAASTFDTNGYFFQIGAGITPAATKFCSANSQTLKCLIEANTRYLFLSQIENGLGLGLTGTPMTLTQGTPLFDMYTTNASTHASNSVESFYCKTVMTGAAGVGGRARFHMTTNVALGGWSNALKAHVEYGASGRTTGLGSALCAEIELSAGTSSGTYAALEAELVLDTNAVTGTATSFLYCNATGAAVATFDTNGYFLQVGAGITPAAGKFVSADSQSLKCLIEANARYIVLSQTENGLGLGSSGTAMTTTFDGTKPLSVYTTCASTDGSTSHEPILFSQTMTGAGQVGGRVRSYMTTNVALGGWSNAFKAEVVYGASGRTTGLGSALCSDVTLSAGTTSGTYTTIEGNLIADSAVSTGTLTSLMRFNIAGTNGTGKTTLNTNGFLFDLGEGIVDTAGGIVDVATITATDFTHRIKIRALGVTMYLGAHTDPDFTT